MLGRILLTTIACSALFVAAGCNRGPANEQVKAKEAEEHRDEGIVKLSDAEAARAGLKTVTLEEQQFADTLQLTATIEANRERIAHVAPRLPGRIVSVSVKLGDAVRQGQVLATLESIEIGEAHAAHAQALAEANVARTALERAQRLHAEEIIAGKDYQRAQGEYAKAQAQVHATAGKLKMMGVAPAAGSQGAPGSRYPVTAPLAGTVIEREAVLGELAKPEENLFVVADLSRVWLQANVGEADLGRVRLGATARARFASYPDRVFEGKVSYVAAVLDKETRTAKAIVELANPKGELRPQMFGNVAIETGGSRSVLAVPEAAVTLVQGVPTVFVEEAAGFRPQPVDIAQRSGGQVVLKSGIEPGELVVTDGVYALKARLLKSQIGEGHAH